MTPNLFTIVMTVYRREVLLPYSIQSVLWQTHPSWELRIYTDGASPAARQVVESVRTTHPEFGARIFYTEEVARPGCFGNHLRARGVQDAAGEYITFLSHDCLYHPDFCATHAAALAEQSCVSVVTLDHWSMFAKNRGPTEQAQYRGRLPTRVPDAACVGTIDAHCLAYPTELLRTQEIFSGLLQEYCADFYIFDRARALVPVRFSERVLAAHI